MSNYNLNSIVSRSEQEALKEMIFKRAQERAQALSENTNKEFTDNIHNDVMELARQSFVAPRNPFSEKVEEKTANIEEKNNEELALEIGFGKRHINEIKAQINYRTQNLNKDLSENEINKAMESTKNDFQHKRSFTGALEFLNTQAALNITQKKDKNFEAIA
jgi:hypothetical protein